MKLNICHHRILAFTRMFLCLTHNAINIALFVGSSDLYLEDEDDEFGKFNDKHEENISFNDNYIILWSTTSAQDANVIKIK